jgi:hypothetical protein
VTRPIDLHVEELVLPAGLRVDAVALRDALEHELSRLVAELGLPSAWTTDGLRLDGVASRGAVAAATPRALGRSLAETVHGGRAR